MADENTCPECGADLSDLDPVQIRHHADYHWNPATPSQLWSEEAWRRRQIVMTMGGHKVPDYHSRGGQ